MAGLVIRNTIKWERHFAVHKPNIKFKQRHSQGIFSTLSKQHLRHLKYTVEISLIENLIENALAVHQQLKNLPSIPKCQGRDFWQDNHTLK